MRGSYASARAIESEFETITLGGGNGYCGTADFFFFAVIPPAVRLVRAPEDRRPDFEEVELRVVDEEGGGGRDFNWASLTLAASSAAEAILTASSALASSAS